MPDKQDRYRKRKAEQGFQRIELLVPEAAAPYLKAYARALRDAHSLGLALPLFEGMGNGESKRTIDLPPSDNAPPRKKQSLSSTKAAKAEPDFSNGLF